MKYHPLPGLGSGAGVLSSALAACLRQNSKQVAASPPPANVHSKAPRPARRSRRPFRPRLRFNRRAVEERQLMLPLEVPVEFPAARTLLAQALEEAHPDAMAAIPPVSFTDEEMIAMHEGLLLSSLITLRKHPGSQPWMEVVDWVLQPDRPLRPFSFRACCCLAGFDHEALREGIVDICKEISELGHTPTPSDVDDEALPCSALKRRQMLRRLYKAMQRALGPRP